VLLLPFAASRMNDDDPSRSNSFQRPGDALGMTLVPAARARL
jgi:hypothetical protein